MSCYEDQPDERDGAIPGCSSSNESTVTCGQLQEDSSSESPITNSVPNTNGDTPKRRRVSRLQEAVSLRYADTVKRNYEEIQTKLMAENGDMLDKMMKAEVDLVKDMLASQENILKATTAQLLSGLKEIFAPTAPSPSTTSQAQAFSSNAFGKTIVLNLKNPQQVTAVSVEQSKKM